MEFFEFIPRQWWGIIGLLLVTGGILYHCGKRGCGLVQESRRRNTLFLSGGIFLLVYSALLGDRVFVILQVVFSIASLWEISRTYRKVSPSV